MQLEKADLIFANHALPRWIIPYEKLSDLIAGLGGLAIALFFLSFSMSILLLLSIHSLEMDSKDTLLLRRWYLLNDKKMVGVLLLLLAGVSVYFVQTVLLVAAKYPTRVVGLVNETQEWVQTAFIDFSGLHGGPHPWNLAVVNEPDLVAAQKAVLGAPFCSKVRTSFKILFCCGCCVHIQPRCVHA